MDTGKFGESSKSGEFEGESDDSVGGEGLELMATYGCVEDLALIIIIIGLRMFQTKVSINMM